MTTRTGPGRAVGPSSGRPAGPLAGRPAAPSSGRPAAPETSCGQPGRPEPARDRPERGCGQPEPASDQPERGAGTQPRLLDRTEMDAWRAFLAASTGVMASLNRELEAEADISMHEYEILVRLFEAPERTLRMSALAQHVSHSRSRLTHTVGRLEKKGYVERSACSTDRRGVDCRLTGAGLAFLRRVAPVHLAGVRRHVIDRLGRDRLAAFTAMLGALVGDAGDVDEP